MKHNRETETKTNGYNKRQQESQQTKQKRSTKPRLNGASNRRKLNTSYCFNRIFQ